MRLLVIANPSAGKGRCGRLLPQIRSCLEATRHDIDFCVSRNQEDLSRLTRLGIETGVDAIIACGGDGTAHYILQALLEVKSEVPTDADFDIRYSNFPQSVALGLIQVGTGNDWALSLGLPTDYQRACDVIKGGKTKRIDVAKVGQRFYVSVAGAGFDAEVARLANRDSVWLQGKAVYLSAVLRTLSKFTPKPVRIQYDDSRFVGEVMLVAVGNGISYGGGLKVVPQARLDDGWLDLCIVKKTTRFEFMRTLPWVYRGSHVLHPAVEIHRARRITIASSTHMELFGDGEYLQDVPVTIEVIPAALRVIVP